MANTFYRVGNGPHPVQLVLPPRGGQRRQRAPAQAILPVPARGRDHLDIHTRSSAGDAAPE